jgi:hypothetical protein
MANIALIDQALSEQFELTSNNQGTLRMRLGPAVPSGGIGAVHKVLFVDNTNAPATGRTGSILAPFATIQEAIAQTVTNVWDDAIVYVAPGTYPGAIVVPTVLGGLVIQGWGRQFTTARTNTDLPDISGAVTQQGVGTYLQFSDVTLTGTGISGTNPVTDPVAVVFNGCIVQSPIEGSTCNVYAQHSRFLGAMTAHTASSLSITADGYTWSNIFTDAPTLSSNYGRNFLDTAMHVYTGGHLVANGLTIGLAADCYLNCPGVREGDSAICVLTAPDTASDFAVTFAFCFPDVAHFTLENISRASTNFNEACNVHVFHEVAAARTAIVP